MVNQIKSVIVGDQNTPILLASHPSYKGIDGDIITYAVLSRCQAGMAAMFGIRVDCTCVDRPGMFTSSTASTC